MADRPQSIKQGERPRSRFPSPSGEVVAKVLIVDDECACRDSLGLLLSLEDFSVETAADAREALEVGTEFAPDILIVDWMFRDAADGLDVAEALRAIHPDLQTIVVTGYPSDDLQARVRSIPAAQYLTKPYQPAQLIAAVRTAATHPE